MFSQLSTLARSTALAAALFSLLSPLGQAQGIDLRYADGTLSDSIEFSVTGTPATIVVVVLGLNSGPTPFPFPCTAGQVTVGALLPNNTWGVLALDASGEGGYGLATPPASAALAGIDIYGQGIEFTPGLPCAFSNVSNPLRLQLLALFTPELLLGQMSGPRRFHGVSQIDDEQLLLTGGEFPLGATNVVLGSVERYDPDTESFDLTSIQLQTPRTRHLQFALGDGRTLVVGGLDAAGDPLDTAEIINVNTGTSTFTGNSLNAPRVEHAGLVLPDGRVLVIGGYAGAYNEDSSVGLPSAVAGEPQKPAAIASAAEIYDPQSNLWSQLPTTLLQRAACGISLLGDDKVLVTGGIAPSAGGGLRATDSCEILDPVTGGVTPFADLPSPRAYHGQIDTATGGALVSGGRDLLLNAPGGPELSAQVVDPVFYEPLSGQAWNASPPDGDTAVVHEIICIRTERGTGWKYIRVGCPLPDADGVGAQTGPGRIYEFNTANQWVQVSQELGERPGHRFAWLELRERLIITGSAVAPLGGGTGNDRTGEQISLQ